MPKFTAIISISYAVYIQGLSKVPHISLQYSVLLNIHRLIFHPLPVIEYAFSGCTKNSHNKHTCSSCQPIT